MEERVRVRVKKKKNRFSEVENLVPVEEQVSQNHQLTHSEPIYIRADYVKFQWMCMCVWVAGAMVHTHTSMQVVFKHVVHLQSLFISLLTGVIVNINSAQKLNCRFQPDE